MIEAMSCGTPVIAFRRGSVPEVLDDGITGFVVNDLNGAVAAVPGAVALDRAGVRGRFEERFTSGRMARDYVALYEELILGSRRGAPSRRNTAEEIGLHAVA
jgi:glycosyltransferase involved in cell wall biosynthesis